MPARKIILHTPIADRTRLGGAVWRWLAEGVCLVAVTGPEAREIEDEIDWLLVAGPDHDYAYDPARFIATSAHPDETMEEVRSFVALWKDSGGKDASVAEVRL